ncbi:MAG: Holliday junction branch migration protein RuvA [Oscillospiraceae bacterium]
MIYSLNGKLTLIEPNFVVVDCGGVGYGIKTSMSTLSKLPKIGENVMIYTHMCVRDDAVELFGFASQSELACFKMLISISGVGPKAATSILSDNTPEKFSLCVVTGDYKALTKAQGIGTKTAQRIVLELKDKISKEQIASGVIGQTLNDVVNNTQNASEAINALMVLGYSQSEATSVITKLDATLTVEEMIKLGLKAMAGKV